MQKIKKIVIPAAAFMLAACSFSGRADAQEGQVPDVFSNMETIGGKLYIRDKKNNLTYPEKKLPAQYTLDQFRTLPTGDENGILLDLGPRGFSGRLYYGIMPDDGSKYAYPVFLGKNIKIENGSAYINIRGTLGGNHDIAGWEKSGRLRLGYRVANQEGSIVYDGKLDILHDGKFRVQNTICEGPFVNCLTDTSAVISFKTLKIADASVEIAGKKWQGPSICSNFEIAVTGLKPATNYKYIVKADGIEVERTLKTAPRPGARKKFTFGYASDCRNGQGGGERNIFGTNAYIMKRIAALAARNDAAFIQFTGDLVNGYITSRAELDLQYANWKRAVEPFAGYVPYYCGMGNHEILERLFDDGSEYGVAVDAFPFAENSAEAAFADNFCNFANGSESEDGSALDPNPDRKDFPPYKENVYTYTYDNVAVIVLNSNYLFTTSTGGVKNIGGNPHAYIMDKQLEWLAGMLKKYESDKNIDHVFVTSHTPALPNGGHVSDDMWCGGDNSVQPYISGKPAQKGIIERRDELLDLIVNKSTKTVAFLTGDEHNYCRLDLAPGTDIYPDSYKPEKLSLGRHFLQITNGSAGAPYYTREQTKWKDAVKLFSTQYALCLFDINGRKVRLRVLNPDTLEEIEVVELK